MSDKIFMPGQKQVFTLPPEADFLPALARALRREFDADNHPERLAGLLVLTPTRRAGRALSEAFAEASGAGAAILPMIRPIGDVDVDEPPFEPGELAELTPDAVSPARRRFELARLILAKEAALERPIGLAGALALAEPLAVLLDDLASGETADLPCLRNEIYDALPADRREAAEFLAILEQAWPARLAELGQVDPGRRRDSVLRALAARWRDAPPAHPVIAAGSTGSIPAARVLLASIADLDQGAVVLPGLDVDADDGAWAQIGDSHPQLSMKLLLEEMGLDRKAVNVWPGAAETVSGRARRRVIAEALRPAEATSDWLSRIDALGEGNAPKFFAAGLEGLSVIEAPDPAAEAGALALLLRETLETPGRTAMLVTPDRTLARRVKVEMQRFGVNLDDSAGFSLAESAAGAFLIALLEAALDPGSAVAFRALTGSPLFGLGRERAELRRRLAHLDRQALRGTRPGRDWPAMQARIEATGHHLRDADKRWANDLIEEIAAHLAPLGDGPASAKHFAEAHARAAEAFAATPDEDGAERLWRGEAGEAAAALIGEFLREADALPDLSLADYAHAFARLAGMRRVRPRYGAHPRLQILGPLEARLQSADLTLLGGLNEGVWPAAIGQDPYMSRGMRKAAGLDAPERRFGLAAHDFAQLAASGEVVLTRSLKSDGAPATASRWLWRLRALIQGALHEDEAEAALERSGRRYLEIWEALDRPQAQSRIQPPAPTPPVAARPRTLSVSNVRNWIRDPYFLYARRVLNLAKLDPPDQAPGPRERGNALHMALELFFQDRKAGALPENAEAELARLSREELEAEGFETEEIVLEARRLARAAHFALDWEARRRQAGIAIAGVETEGEWVLDGPAGPFTLKGRADRIDRLPDGRLEMIDYKTGSAPTPKATRAMFEPQLPLIAAMAAEGVFADIGAAPSSRLTYLKLGGGRVPGEEKGMAAEDLPERYGELLTRLIARYDDETTAYPSQPRAQYVNEYGDYDQLARRKEWASATGDDDGEGAA